MWSTQYMPRLIQTELAARKKLLILSTSFSILWLWNADLQSFNLLLTVFDNSGYLLLGNTGVLKVVYPLHPLQKTQGDVDITRPLGHVCCNICIWPSVQLVPQPVIPVGAASQVQLSSGGCTLSPPKYEFVRSVCDFCICKSLVAVIKLLIYNYTQQKNKSS